MSRVMQNLGSTLCSISVVVMLIFREEVWWTGWHHFLHCNVSYYCWCVCIGLLLLLR